LQHLTEALAVVERRDQQHEPRFERKIPGASSERPLQTLRQRDQARHHTLVVEPVRDRRQLNERERVAGGVPKDLTALRGGQVTASYLEQPSCRLWIKWLEPKLRQLARAENGRVPLASRRQQDDWI